MKKIRFYVYNCICHPDGLLWSLPFDYKLMKQCNGKNNEEAHCYQNNIYSPEVYCECRKKFLWEGTKKEIVVQLETTERLT